MECFNKNYVRVYDILYNKKNYNKEFYLIKKIIKKYLNKPTSLLDLGCGTGQYSNLMTSLKLDVTGVDSSLSMLKIAKKRYKSNKKLKFIKSKIEKINLKKKFDIISALFHILSYQTSKNKINKFFFNSKQHLKKNGILIFDFWYKDGVINLQTPLRIREVENNFYKVVRLTVSKWYKKDDQIFDVHRLVIMNKKNKKITQFQETHRMKYFKITLIKNLLKKYNFRYLESLDLQSEGPISLKSWGALVVAQKI